MIVLNIGHYKYYVPLSSPKRSDYVCLTEGTIAIRKSIIPIIRMIDGNELLGTLKFNNMLPVPDSELILYDVRSESDAAYKTLINKEIRFINRNKSDILRHANILYKQKKAGDQRIGYLNSTFDFQYFETQHDLFVAQQGHDQMTWHH